MKACARGIARPEKAGPGPARGCAAVSQPGPRTRPFRAAPSPRPAHGNASVMRTALHVVEARSGQFVGINNINSLASPASPSPAPPMATVFAEWDGQRRGVRGTPATIDELTTAVRTAFGWSTEPLLKFSVLLLPPAQTALSEPRRGAASQRRGVCARVEAFAPARCGALSASRCTGSVAVSSAAIVCARRDMLAAAPLVAAEGHESSAEAAHARAADNAARAASAEGAGVGAPPACGAVDARVRAMALCILAFVRTVVCVSHCVSRTNVNSGWTRTTTPFRCLPTPSWPRP
jgi:hypothetical protein